MITVEFPGLTLTNEPGQYGAWLADLQGWFDGVGLDSNRRQRPRADGFFGKRRTYKTGREVGVVGQHLTPGDPDALWATHDAVMALQSIVGAFEVAVTGPRGRQTAMLELDGRPLFTLDDEVGSATFEVPLLGRDPRKYGEPVQAGPMGLPTGGGGVASPVKSPVKDGNPGNSGRVETVNTGGAETWSLLDVTGGLGGGFELTCTETGSVVRFERQIPIGSTVRVDLKSMTARLDTINNVTTYLTRKEGWSVPKGAVRTVQFNSIGAVTGTPTLTAYTAPADL